MKIDKFLNSPNPYIFNKKNNFFFKRLKYLTFYHYKKSVNYKKILRMFDLNQINNLYELPFLHADIFKSRNMISTNKNEIFKILKSSGTSSGSRSKIFLDKENSINQRLTLSKLFQYNFGSERYPMLVVDKNPKFKSPKEFDAKTAAFLGFSSFGSNHTFLLDKDNNIDFEVFNKFTNKHKGKIFIFGFTSSVYENLIKKFNNSSYLHRLKNAYVLHGGGWKKMEDQKISNLKFKNHLLKKHGIKRVVNYYGMIEQAGSIFFECEKCNYFKTSIFSNVLIRDKQLRSINNDNIGLIQLLSILPSSYPGHSILTDDLGFFKKDKNNCECGKEGSPFKVLGRNEMSEIRGCSDV